KWRDINFIGGHSKDRDAGSLERTARRELWEEVPSIRYYSEFLLEPLTPKMPYGPIKSLSRGDVVKYEVQFFLVRVESSPQTLVEMLGSRSKNIWVSQYDLLLQARFRVSGLVRCLDESYPGGLDRIPYSSGIDLAFMRDRIERLNSKQLEF